MYGCVVATSLVIHRVQNIGYTRLMNSEMATNQIVLVISRYQGAHIGKKVSFGCSEMINHLIGGLNCGPLSDQKIT